MGKEKGTGTVKDVSEKTDKQNGGSGQQRIVKATRQCDEGGDAKESDAGKVKCKITGTCVAKDVVKQSNKQKASSSGDQQRKRKSSNKGGDEETVAQEKERVESSVNNKDGRFQKMVEDMFDSSDDDQESDSNESDSSDGRDTVDDRKVSGQVPDGKVSAQASRTAFAAAKAAFKGTEAQWRASKQRSALIQAMPLSELKRRKLA